MVTIKGNDNWKDLKDICFQKFGKGKKKWMSKECYWWFGETTFMALNYNESSEEGALFLQSVVVARERNECEQWERKQKTKEGAEKGF